MASIRPAAAGDHAFVVDMFLAALSWDPQRSTAMRGALAVEPRNARYVDGWPRAEDVGVIALDDDGAAPLGACWLRFFTGAEPGYGFVAEDVPEIAIGVVSDARGRGIGAAMLDAIADAARERGVRAMSLSVEHGNPARRLYERAGYVEVSRSDDAITMLRPL